MSKDTKGNHSSPSEDSDAVITRLEDNGFIIVEVS